jgi:hypothetical protein
MNGNDREHTHTVMSWPTAARGSVASEAVSRRCCPLAHDTSDKPDPRIIAYKVLHAMNNVEAARKTLTRGSDVG